MSEFGLIKGYRQAGAAGSVPDITFRKMVALALRTWPFMSPLLKHLIVLGVVATLGSATAVVGIFVGTDLMSNKVLVGEKLQPIQATVLFVGDEYVDDSNAESVGDRLGEVLSVDNLINKATGKAGKKKGATKKKVSQLEKPKLTQEQRKTVRNRLIIWGVVGSVIASLSFMIISYYTMWVWQSVNQNLRVAMLERAESLSLKYHDNARIGDAIFRVYQDSAMIVNLVKDGIVIPMSMLYAILLGLLFVIAFDPLFALVVVIAAVPMALLIVGFTPRIRRKALNNRMANSDLTSRLQEVFSAIKIVKANRAESKVYDRFYKDSLRALNAAYFLRLDMGLLLVLVAMLGGATLLICEYVMISWVVVERETFLGAWAVALIGFRIWNLGSFQVARGRVQGLAFMGRGVVTVWIKMQDMFIALERAFYLLDLEPDVVDPENPISFPQPIENVTWQDVQFGYGPSQTILDGINLRADAGTVTAIVGGTGAGKSTVMSMLLRLYDPDEGQVLVNDVSIKDMAIDELRGNTAIALQKNVLFADTVANNISYTKPDASREEIETAAKVACADEFIQMMSEGYDTELGERGGKLSTGQRQRLSIARAVVRDTPILILDEPTASLDARTEHQVLSNLAEWGKGRVIFLITHRLSTIRNADQIAFLENGQFVEYGGHDELMAMEDGRYRNFVIAETDGIESHSATIDESNGEDS